jgi:hypothetical protein
MEAQSIGWSFPINSITTSETRSVEVDAAGNTYTCGTFAGAIRAEFIGSSSAVVMTTLGDQGVFVAKHDDTLDLVWAWALDGVGQEYCNALALDTGSNVIVTGSFEEELHTPGGPVLQANGLDDIFVAKLDAATGITSWAFSVGGTGSDAAMGLAVDGDDNVYVGGAFGGEVDFDPSTGTDVRVPAGGLDAFLVSYAGNGAHRWTKTFGAAGEEKALDLAFDNRLLGAGIYVVGNFELTVDFQNDFTPCLGCTRTSNGSSDAFVADYDLSTGDLIEVLAFGGSGVDVGNAVESQNDGSFYVTGRFDGIVDFNPFGDPVVLDSDGSHDLFLGLYTSGFMSSWAINPTGNGASEGHDLDLGADGHVRLSGSFNTITGLDFDPGPGEYIVTSTENSDDILAASYSSSGALQWALGVGSNRNENGLAVAAGPDNYTTTTGYFKSDVDFDPGTGVAILQTVDDEDQPSAFLARYDLNGLYEWAFSFGLFGNVETRAVHVDDVGNVYACGRFAGVVDTKSYGSTTAGVLENVGDDGGFVAKYDNGLNLLWSWALDGIDNDYCNALALDSSGDMIVAGSFEGQVEFRSGPTLHSSGLYDIFVAKLNGETGLPIWAFRVGGSDDDQALSVIVDGADDIYVGGFFEGEVDFDPSGAVNLRVSSGLEDAFVASYTSSGDFRWVRSFGAGGSDRVSGMDFDHAIFSTGLYATGHFVGTVDFQNDFLPCLPCTRTSGGYEDVFVASYDLATGAFKDVITVGGGSDDYGHAIVSEDDGEFYITGSFAGNVEFNPEGPPVQLWSGGGRSLFLAKYAAGGLCRWAVNPDGGNSHEGRAVALGNDGTVRFTGWYSAPGGADFDPTSGELELTTAGDTEDIFVAAYTEAGKLVGALGVGGTRNDVGLAIATDPTDQAVVGGLFKHDVDFDPKSSEAILQTVDRDLSDAFLAQYRFGQVYSTSLKVWLEGPFSTGSSNMSLALNASGALSLSHPYTGSPWQYTGTESVATTDANSNSQPDFLENHPDLVDWVLVSLLWGDPTSPPLTLSHQRAGFVHRDGWIVDIDGHSPLGFVDLPGTTPFYTVVDHRNHVPIMSSSTVDLSSGSASWDFTTSQSQAYTGGPNPMVDLSATGVGPYAMYAGDINADGSVQALDFNSYLSATLAGTTGYVAADCNLDGAVQALDFNLYLSSTLSGASSQVPPGAY